MIEIEYIKKLKFSLEKLYKKDAKLFKRNKKRGLCERCLVFRLSMYLQKIFMKYHVDCDFNSETWGYYDSDGNYLIEENTGKHVRNPNGTFTNRFVDIIIHKRGISRDSNLLCFEIKKWNNYNKKATAKDINNLKFLTKPPFNYKLGFFIVLGKTFEKTKIIVFDNGRKVKELIGNEIRVFRDNSLSGG